MPSPAPQAPPVSSCSVVDARHCWRWPVFQFCTSTVLVFALFVLARQCRPAIPIITKAQPCRSWPLPPSPASDAVGGAPSRSPSPGVIRCRCHGRSVPGCGIDQGKAKAKVKADGLDWIEVLVKYWKGVGGRPLGSCGLREKAPTQIGITGFDSRRATRARSLFPSSFVLGGRPRGSEIKERKESHAGGGEAHRSERAESQGFVV